MVTKYPPKINRAQQRMKQRTSWLNRVSKRITAYDGPEYPGDVNSNFAIFNQPLNYHRGNLWWIRHSELQYESEGEPL